MSGDTAASTDSGQGSGSLSNPFIVVPVEQGGESLVQTSGSHVVAPVGSAHLHVRRSAQVASSRSQSLLANSPPAMEFVAAPPGGRHKICYAYQVLQPVAEEAGPSINLDALVGTAHARLAGGLQNPVPISLERAAGSSLLTGRKRSATSARVVVVPWLGNWLLCRIFHPSTLTNPVVKVFLRLQNLVYPLLTNFLSPYHPW